MNATISSQLRPFVVGFAICAANVATAQLQYPDAPAQRGDEVAFGEANYESAVPAAPALLRQSSTRSPAMTGQSSVFGTDPRLENSLTALLPLFSTVPNHLEGTSLGQRETFVATALASRSPVDALGNPFGENLERFRSVIFSLETIDR